MLISIPMCEKPRIIINPQALYLIQHKSGQFLFDGLFNQFEGRNITKFPVRLVLRKAYKLCEGHKYEALEPYHVVGSDGDEVSLFLVVGCGKCELCGYKRQMDKVVRASMESAISGVPPVWFTLTYRNSDLPANGELRYKDVQDFHKRLRIRLQRLGLPTDYRYICSGEYGSVDKTCRPHYHIIMFNNPFRCSELDVDKFNQLRNLIFTAWSHADPQGFDFGQCYGNAAGYATKYLTKSFSAEGHYIKPFVHCSSYHGGLSRPLLESKRQFYEDNPQQPNFQYIDNNGSVQSVNFSSYIVNTFYPSPVKSVNYRQRRLYRELIYTLQQAVLVGVMTSFDAYDYAEEYRPYKNAVRNSFLPLASGNQCDEYFPYQQEGSYVLHICPGMPGNILNCLESISQELDYDVLVDDKIIERHKKFHDLHRFDFQSYLDKVANAQNVKKKNKVLKSKIKL